MKIYIIIFLFLISCQSSNKLTLKSFDKKYTLNFNQKAKISTAKDDGGYIFKSALFQNGALIYLTDDNKNGSESLEKETKYGKDIYLKILNSDTLTLTGVNDKNLHWKEIKRGKVILGYKNVPPVQKNEFDSILNAMN